MSTRERKNNFVNNIKEAEEALKASLPLFLLNQATERKFTADCSEAKYKFDQAVAAAWGQCRRAKATMSLTDEEFRLMYREIIAPAGVEYLGDLQEAGTKRRGVIQEWVRPR